MDKKENDTIRFEALEQHDDQALVKMSLLASSIVKEHFDPIIGSAQNDYMIARFQSVESIRAQLADGYRYFFVLDADGAAIGFVAFAERDESLYLSKFYLVKEQRGRGYARKMLAFVVTAARKAQKNSVTLNVNRGNDARFAYEKMGFRIVREEVNDIGAGFVMDDYVYELRVESR